MSVLRKVLLTVAAFALICACERFAHADPLVLSFSNPNQTGAPGQTATFSAAIFNPNPTAVTLSLPTTLSFVFNETVPEDEPILGFDVMPFSENFLNQTIAAGGTFGPLPLFTLTLDANVTIGAIYSGTFCFNCGPISFGNYVTNAAPFTLTVVAPTAPVPEPAGVVLVGTGLLGLIGAARRRRGKKYVS